MKRLLAALLCVMILMPACGLALTEDEIAKLVEKQTDQGLHLLWDIPFEIGMKDFCRIVKEKKGIDMVSETKQIDDTFDYEAFSVKDQSLILFGFPFSLIYQYNPTSGIWYEDQRELDFIDNTFDPNLWVGAEGVHETFDAAVQAANVQIQEIANSVFDTYGMPEIMEIEYSSDASFQREGKGDYVKEIVHVPTTSIFQDNGMISIWELVEQYGLPSNQCWIKFRIIMNNVKLYIYGNFCLDKTLARIGISLNYDSSPYELSKPEKEVRHSKPEQVYSDTGL